MHSETDRVRAHTARSVLAAIDGDTHQSLLLHAQAGPEAVRQRIDELEREWDTDRVIEAEAAAMALVGLALGTIASRKLYAIPAFVAGMVLTHALTGFYPLLPVLRRLGVRTQKEIQRERFALKAMRGDFDQMRQDAGAAGERTEETLAGWPGRAAA